MAANKNIAERQPENADGRSTRFASHRVKRRDKLIAQTTTLLAQHGLRALTIDDIAEKLEVAKPALYRYFSSKEDLIQSVLSAAREQLVAADIAGEQEDWRLHLLGAIRFISERPETFIVLYRHAANDPEYHSYFKVYFDQIRDITSARLSRFSNLGETAPEAFDFCAQALVSFMFNSTLSWLETDLWDTDEFHKWLVRSTISLTESWARQS